MDAVMGVAAMLPCVACIGLAGWLARNGKAAWIAFMVLAIIFFPTIRVDHG